MFFATHMAPNLGAGCGGELACEMTYPALGGHVERCDFPPEQEPALTQGTQCGEARDRQRRPSPSTKWLCASILCRQAIVYEEIRHLLRG
jgi:hypothetical protein